MSFFKNHQGFTLIETLIYIGVVALVLAAFVNFSLVISGTGAKSFVVAEVNTAGQEAMEIISQNIRKATSVVTPARGNSGSVLEVVVPGSVDHVVIQVSSGTLQLTQGVNPPINLTSSLVEVSNFSVTNLARNNAAENINVSFDVDYKESTSQEFTYGQSFTSAFTRKK